MITQHTVNDNDHFCNMMNAMFIGKLSSEAKAQKKLYPDKKVFFDVIRSQFNIGPFVDSSFVKNKQNYIASTRKLLNNLPQDKLIEYMYSSEAQRNVEIQGVDIVIDVIGVIVLENVKDPNFHVSTYYAFYFNSHLLSFINLNIRGILKGCGITYSPKYFKVGRKNADKFLGSIIIAYIDLFPGDFPELFKDKSYEAILDFIPMVLNCFKNGKSILGSEEEHKKYLNSFINNWINFDEDIAKYVSQNIQPGKYH